MLRNKSSIYIHYHHTVTINVYINLEFSDVFAFNGTMMTQMKLPLKQRNLLSRQNIDIIQSRLNAFMYQCDHCHTSYEFK